ncbi:exopolysaccharide biosynthesis protein [Salipiger aestuarii]|uniref:Mrp family chromosome partitioning ATPase n=1 Tax=Salipiger aestuarii TaxID=568098 RepID=A0A327YI48_9RHOB|nr:exopolysaccharide biosynthesis protein [Salipiger aestuarii]KAB2541369.1 exopolysaccharide biosynthesis protein [Salipiger aestuarii]RAK20022.1 Mrp family chromosome partitioning ATPase [Salipiger aestuarii]
MTDDRKFRRRNPLSAEIAAGEQAAKLARAEDARRMAAAEEQSRIAAAQEAERQHKLTAERQAEADRRAAAERQGEVERLAEVERRAKAEQQAEAEHQAQAERQAGADRQAKDDASPDMVWSRLPVFSVNARHLDRNRIVTAGRQDPAHAAFDVLRTRLLQALSENGWRRVAITSPTKDCGKTFTAANLAISLSRHQNCRALLIDCDLRRPTLHKVMGADNPGSMGDVLRGRLSAEAHFQRMGDNDIHAGPNVAFGFNGVVEPYASELLQSPETAQTLQTIERRLAPDVILFDLPPALFSDDVIAFRPLFDGVLLVVGGGLTTDKEIREVERRLGENTPLLGTVLNRAEGTQLSKYSY